MPVALALVIVPLAYLGTIARRRRFSLRWMLLAPPVAIAALIVGTGFVQGANTALLLLNMGLISAIMALGVNLQWGYAGLFNIGIMGFVALGGLAAVEVGVALGLDAARVAGVPVVGLVALVARDLHLLGVDHDDIVAHVHMRCVSWFVLATQDLRDL